MRVMSEDEARDYQGVTIEERKDSGEQHVEEPHDRYGRDDDLRGSGIRIHTFSLKFYIARKTTVRIII